jgi:lipopolysaccharide export LptBFGC system permease protein LptF
MERLIDPAIADLQTEYANAKRQGAIWRAHWILLAGYAACAKLLTFAGMKRLADSAKGDERVFGQAGLVFSAATIVVTLLLAVPEVSRFSHGAHASPGALTWYVIPSVLPLSVPIGLAFAIACGLNGQRLTRRLVTALFVVALLCAIGMFMNMELVVPDSNQAFREAVMGRPLGRGDHELRMSELTDRIAPRPDQIRRRSMTYHSRWSVSAAPLSVACLGVALLPWLRGRRWRAVLTAIGISVSYYTWLMVAEEAAIWTMQPVILIAWSPNIAFTVLALGLASISPPPVAVAD